MIRINRFLSEKAFFLSLFLIIIGLWPLSQISKTRVDNSIDVWLDHQSKEYQDYREFTEEYGSDEWILIAFSIGDVSWEKALTDLKTITSRLKQIEEGVNAISIANKENPATAVLKPILLSEDRKTAGIFIMLPKVVQLDRTTLFTRIEAILASYRHQYHFHLGGPSLLNVELDRASKHQIRLLLSLALILSGCGLYWIFRSLKHVLVAIGASGLCVLWTLGIAAGSGMALNMITTVLPVLLWVYTLTGGIHVIYRVRLGLKEGATLNQAIFGAFQSILFPYSIAYLTTAVGFLSLLFSPMQPVRDLGLYTAIGIGLGFLSNLVLIPGALKLFEKKGLGFIRQSPVFCAELRDISKKIMKKMNTPFHSSGTYVCTEGPRLETPAEIRMYKRLGGDLVGMTLVPECFLAKELEICYLPVCYLTNYAEGISRSKYKKGILFEGMQKEKEKERVDKAHRNLPKIIIQIINEAFLKERSCSCKEAMLRYKKSGIIGNDWKSWIKS